MVTVLEMARPRHPEKAQRIDTPILPKPDWIRVKAPGSTVYAETRKIVRDNGLVTVCEEAGCPNIGECWSKKSPYVFKDKSPRLNLRNSPDGLWKHITGITHACGFASH